MFMSDTMPSTDGEGVGMSRFGSGNGEVLAENVQCAGTEEELVQCGLEDNLGSVSEICQDGDRSAGIICHVGKFSKSIKIIHSLATYINSSYRGHCGRRDERM